MKQSSSLSITQVDAIKAFNALRFRALWGAWLAKIMMSRNSPRSLVGSDASGLSGRHLTGTHHIRVKNIVGTIRRSDDFDQEFRPLKQQLRDRWVDTLLQFKTRGWRPIVVHRVGERYYVAKGQYRVSVARSLGLKCIEAHVWDHSTCRAPLAECGSKPKVLRSRTESFSTN